MGRIIDGWLHIMIGQGSKLDIFMVFDSKGSLLPRLRPSKLGTKGNNDGDLTPGFRERVFRGGVTVTRVLARDYWIVKWRSCKVSFG